MCVRSAAWRHVGDSLFEQKRLEIEVAILAVAGEPVVASSTAVVVHQIFKRTSLGTAHTIQQQKRHNRMIFNAIYFDRARLSSDYLYMYIHVDGHYVFLYTGGLNLT